MNYPKHAEPAEVLEVLTTPSAKEAFEVINGLGPMWTMGKNAVGEVWLEPNIGIKRLIETEHHDSSMLFMLEGTSLGKTFDEVVTNKLAALIKGASKSDAVVVVNSQTPAPIRVEYTYDKTSGTFLTYKK